MGWSIEAAGRCPDERAERSLILRLALAVSGTGAGSEHVSVGTDYHGQLDLSRMRDLAPGEEA